MILYKSKELLSITHWTSNICPCVQVVLMVLICENIFSIKHNGFFFLEIKLLRHYGLHGHLLEINNLKYFYLDDC